MKREPTRTGQINLAWQAFLGSVLLLGALLALLLWIPEGPPETSKEPLVVYCAAGIKARVIQVTSITLSGKFYVIPDTAGSSKDAYARYKRAVVSALGSLGTLAASRLISSLLFEVSPRDVTVLSFVSVGLVAVAMAACLLPARRAVAVDAAEVMRGD